MVTYEDIERVNAQLKSEPIHDKMYVPVAEKVKAFRMLHPNGLIVTECDKDALKGGVAVYKATVYDEDGRMLATGHAREKLGDSFINRTSFLENSETSAIGRALSFCGFGISESIASYEEVENAKKNQNSTKDGMILAIEEIKKNYPDSQTLKLYVETALNTANVDRVSKLKSQELKDLKLMIEGSMKAIEEEQYGI